MSPIPHILQLIKSSGRNVWRFSDLKYWTVFQQHHLLTLSSLKSGIDYRSLTAQELKKGKRVIPKWTKLLMQNDLIFLLDKEYYYGLAIANMEYHPHNPTIQLSVNQVKPAITIEFIHELTTPTKHTFSTAAHNLDAFSQIDQGGFSLANCLGFLAAEYPATLTHLLEVLSNDHKNTVETNELFFIHKENNILDKYKNVNHILYGPPGTGKTYTSIEMAVEIAGYTPINNKECQSVFKKLLSTQIELVTFHSNYTYEDFIQGLRPVTDKKKNLQFELKDGIFKRIADKATLNYLQNKGQLTNKERFIKKQLTISSTTNFSFSLNEEQAVYEKKTRQKQSGFYKNYILIIDEINRTNISNIFGELITLLEKDKRLGEKNELIITLPSGELFVVPPNLYLIGTMNTADKSISLLDMALRRRFDFKPLYPRYDLPNLAEKEILQALNQQLTQLKGIDFQIGHAYFLRDKLGTFDLAYVMNHQIIPMFYEYFRQDSSIIERILTIAGVPFQMGSHGLLEVIEEK